MARYKGANRKAGPRFFWVPMCFTNNDKAVFWALAILGEAASGALIGLILGLSAAVVTGVPVASTGIGAGLAALIGTTQVKIGLAVGAVAGACYGFWLAWNSDCPECGLCVEVLHFQPFWPFSKIATLIPMVPVVMIPSTNNCSLIPPGCP